MKLKNKNAIITGGSRGIGGAISKLFAEEGANITFCHLNDDNNSDEMKSYILSLQTHIFMREILKMRLEFMMI